VSPELVSIYALVAMFVIATVLPVNMGALALVAAFLVGTLVADLSTDDILGGFPGDLFVTLVGITYVFALAQNNGTIDWLVDVAVRAVRGRIAAIPWVMFGVAAVLTAIGAVSPAAVAIIAPVALGFAAQYSISPLLMGLMVVHGAQAGGFSPISIYGGIVNQVVDRAELPGNEIALFLASLGFNTAVAVLIFALFGGRELLRRREPLAGAEPVGGPAGALTGPVSAPGPGGGDAAASRTGGAGPGGAAARTDLEHEGSDDATGDTLTRARARTGRRPSRDQLLTVVGLVAMAVASLAFDLDVGLVAMTVAVLLTLLSPGTAKGAVDKIAWSTVLLIGGVITYVAVLQELGTIDYVGKAVAGVGAPLLAAILLCYIGAIVSAFASSVGVLGATIPLAVPFLLEGEIGAVGLVAALAVSSTIVDVSPFSTNGALVLANAKGIDRDVFFRQLMAYGALVVLLAPLATWLVLVVPGWL
jgi:di/tricarboxylate transporter